MDNKTEILRRFLSYVKIETTSNLESSSIPSSLKQFNLAKLLVEELHDLNIEVTLDEFGYVYATIPSNVDYNTKTVGFIAHLDTSPDFTGKNVSPQIIENYDGQIIKLNAQYNLDPKYFPELLNYKGDTLITTNGSTLLGADDKAGISIIMQLCKTLVTNQQIKHGIIKIAFTPDEEIGLGAKNFNLDKFNANFAYTIDGGGIGELEYENFNAASAIITIHGRNIHPGLAKGKMISSITLARKFDQLIDDKKRPENTELFEGFYMLSDFNGTIEKTTLKYLIREHDKTKFNDMKEDLIGLVKQHQIINPNALYEIQIIDTYYNMKEYIQPYPYIMKYAKNAFLRCNITPNIGPIRGGTDGAHLSKMGLPCPNIFTGGHNFHGRYEYISLESMYSAYNVILTIVNEVVLDIKND